MAKALKISHDLLEAYKGYFEDDRDFRLDYEAYLKAYTSGTPPKTKEEFLVDWCTEQIRSDTPKRRLEVYCEWNGIIGYASRLFELATGNL